MSLCVPTFRFRIGHDQFDAPAGTSVAIPRGVGHAWANVGTKQARILLIFTSGVMEEFFPEIGLTPPEQWQALAERHDTWISGPPLLAGKQ